MSEWAGYESSKESQRGSQSTTTGTAASSLTAGESQATEVMDEGEQGGSQTTAIVTVASSLITNTSQSTGDMDEAEDEDGGESAEDSQTDTMVTEDDVEDVDDDIEVAEDDTDEPEDDSSPPSTPSPRTGATTSSEQSAQHLHSSPATAEGQGNLRRHRTRTSRGEELDRRLEGRRR